MKLFTLKSLFIILCLATLLGSCDKEEDSLELHSNPGSSFLDVENDGYVVALNAQAAPEGQTGSWKIFMGENGRFDDETNAHSNFFGEPGETYLLGWEVSHGNQYEVANINVSFKALDPRILTAVEDTLHNNISLQLEAEAPKFGAEGRWEIVNGQGGRIENFQNPNARFMGKEDESYILRWTLSYGSKEESLDFSFQTDVLRAQAGFDRLDIKTSKDESKYCNLEAFLPAGATGNWQIIEGGKGTVHSTADPNSIFEGIADSLYTLTWTVQLDEYQAVDTVKLRFRGKYGVWTDSRDAQTYRFVEVNGIEWMAENFNYVANNTQYGRSWYYGQSDRAYIENGHPIETEEDRKFYGRLYNYYAAVESIPEGWRLPTRKDFEELVNHLGGELYAVEKLKLGGETGTNFNYSGSLSYSNGITGSRDYYSGMDESGIFWTSYYDSDRYEGIGQIFSQSGSNTGITLLSAYFSGVSVRYIRDVQ